MSDDTPQVPDCIGHIGENSGLNSQDDRSIARGLLRRPDMLIVWIRTTAGGLGM
jgi:hypothetical protein